MSHPAPARQQDDYEPQPPPVTHAYGKLPAKDVGRARAFYAENLGLTPFGEFAENLLYEAGGSTFIIFLSKGAPSGTHDQLGLVVDDLDSVVARLRAKGVTFEEYPAPPGATMTNDYERPRRRFPGAFGSAVLYPIVRRVILFRTEHSPRVFAQHVQVDAGPHVDLEARQEEHVQPAALGGTPAALTKSTSGTTSWSRRSRCSASTGRRAGSCSAPTTRASRSTVSERPRASRCPPDCWFARRRLPAPSSCECSIRRCTRCWPASTRRSSRR